jgi:hypothetical protein
MVLPVRIELTTSALPRMRSTTELRQHMTAGPSRGRAYGESGWTRQGRERKVCAMATRNPEKERRLAEALRANLRKRKAGREPEATNPPTDPAATPHNAER